MITPTTESYFCPACNGDLTTWFVKRTAMGCYPIQRCGQCRSAFTMPRPSKEEIVALYCAEAKTSAVNASERFELAVNSERRRPALTTDGKRIAQRLKAIRPKGRVLDIGAGDGFHSHALISAGFSVEALEPGATAREVFRRLNGFLPMDGFLDSDFAASRKSCYQAVLLSQVLEHIPDLELSVRLLNRTLEVGGIAVIAVPHFRSWLSILTGKHDMFISPPEHLNYFTVAGLVRLMERHGFELVDYETVIGSRQSGSFPGSRRRFSAGRQLGSCTHSLLLRIG